MKTTRATFRPNARRVTAETCLTQWDYGQVLAIDGLDLPETFEVDFSLDPMDGISTPGVGTNGAVCIPDVLLEQSGTIYAFIFLHEEGDDGETQYRIAIPVEKRPERGTQAPDPVEQSVITQTIAALNAGVSRAEDAADRAEDTVKSVIRNIEAEADSDLFLCSFILAIGITSDEPAFEGLYGRMEPCFIDFDVHIACHFMPVQRQPGFSP